MNTKTNCVELIFVCFVCAAISTAPGAAVFQRIKSFGFTEQSGAYPGGNVIRGSDGALYGTTTTGGGGGGHGAVFRLNPDGSGYTVLKSFNYSDGAQPSAALVQGIDGALYGTTTSGGSSEWGTVFKLNPDGTSYTVLKSFNNSDGAYPYASLIQATDGAFYGTTSQGGSGYGTVFKVNPDGTGFVVLNSFNDSDGAYPYASLIQATDGALYGTTSQGGSGGFGTVFKLNPDGTGFAVFNLSGAPGPYLAIFPFSALIQGSDGALYGTSQNGGSAGGGTVFKLNSDWTGFTILKSFNYCCGGIEIFPSSLLQGIDGALYGTTDYGGTGSGDGQVFKLNPDGTGYTVLKNFDYLDGAHRQAAALMQGTDGALYGTALEGGSGVAGTVFKLNPDGTSFVVIKNFQRFAGDAAHPYASLIQATDGALYGTTTAGGTVGGGTVFRLGMDGTGYAVLKNFNSFPAQEGFYPYGGLVQGSDDALYGAIVLGAGASFNGRLFKVKPDGTDYTVLKSFNYYDGSAPYAGLLRGIDGALYGTTIGGGGSGVGTVFKLNADGTVFAVLKSFNGSDGHSPFAALVRGTDGALYGTTVHGGDFNAGTAYKLNADGSGFRVLKSFSGTDGWRPYGALMQGTDGALYGTTELGGSGFYGTVFKLNADGTGFTVLKNCNGTDGANPVAGLVQGSDDALYGTTPWGGDSDAGTVFKLKMDGTEFAVLRSFNPYDGNGARPNAALVQGADGAVYGTTAEGGDIGLGTVFRLVVDTIPPMINCPPNITVPCSSEPLVHVTFSVTATDDFDPSPAITCVPPSGSNFPVGTTTVNSTATDAAGNSSQCAFTVTRTPLEWVGFLAPIEGADATGGSFAEPVATFKMNSIIPVRFELACNVTAVETGIHTLQAIQYSDSTTSDPPLDVSAPGAATEGNQFQLSGSGWQFNIGTRASGMSVGRWLLRATMSDGSQHTAWIQLK